MLYALLGAVAIGLVLGLLGSGGSILTVPVLVYLAGEPDKVAIAESLAIVGAIALVGALPYARQRLVDWHSVLYFGVPGIIGTYGGAALSKVIPGTVQLALFAVVMILAAVLMFRGKKSVEGAADEPHARQALWKIALEGLVVGVLTGLVGVGGGFLIVPALVLLGGLSMRLAVGTSLLIIAAKSAAGFWKYVDVLAETGLQVDWKLIGIFALIGIAGSFVGNALSQRVPQAQLKRGFAVFLVIMGGFILVKEGPAAIRGGAAEPGGEPVVATVAAQAPAPQEAPRLVWSADELAARLSEPSVGEVDAPGVAVLHVARDRAAYDAAHLPGARFLPLSAVATNRDGLVNVLPHPDTLAATFRRLGLTPETQVVLYGDLGGLSAARAFFAFDALGHERVAVLDGGADAWQTAGYALTTDVPPRAEPGTFAARRDPAHVATTADVAARLGEAVLLDARPPEQYTGTVPGTDVQRPGHLPGAVSIFWKEDLAPDGTLRPLDALRARYAAHGAVPGQPVITYCRTGMQASHTYLVARLLGLRPLLYDGSYLAWSNQTDYPVETGAAPRH